MIPALDLINGRVVRLQQGDFSQQTTYSETPLAIVQDYIAQGASYLHFVDLDGAKNPNNRQHQLLAQIAKACSVPCQVGGGVRRQEDIAELLALGFERVVVGSAAVKQPQTFLQWLQHFGGERIVLALDVNVIDGHPMVATDGWQSTSSVSIEEVLPAFIDNGGTTVLCTDISRDGMLSGANSELYSDLVARYPKLNWQASGGVHSLADLAQLKGIGCSGAILGKSLLTGAFTVKEAVSCWRNA